MRTHLHGRLGDDAAVYRGGEYAEFQESEGFVRGGSGVLSLLKGAGRDGCWRRMMKMMIIKDGGGGEGGLESYVL